MFIWLTQLKLCVSVRISIKQREVCSRGAQTSRIVLKFATVQPLSQLSASKLERENEV